MWGSFILLRLLTKIYFHKAMVATVVMRNLKAVPTKMATTPAVLVIRLQSFDVLCLGFFSFKQFSGIHKIYWIGCRFSET